MTLADIFGQDPAVRALRGALAADRLPGSYLFVGPDGVGKSALALAFAAAAACTNPVADPYDACGRCQSCRMLASGNQPEIVRVEPAGDQMQIWQFWDRPNRPPGVLQQSMRYASAIGRKTVFIIERADLLNTSAANSLLKVLEEPPPYVLFVLTAPNAARILPTIQSRCQMVRLTAAPVDAVAAQLVAQLGVEPERAAELAAHTEGRIGWALRLAREPGVEAEINAIMDVALSACSATPLAALRVADQIRKTAAGLKALLGAAPDRPAAGAHSPGGGGEEPEAETTGKETAARRPLGIVLDLMLTLYRDLLAVRLGGNGARVVNESRRVPINDAARTRPPERWIACLDDLLSARRKLDQNVSVRLLTDWLAIRLVVGDGAPDGATRRRI